jgi:hypothetical protein
MVKLQVAVMPHISAVEKGHVASPHAGKRGVACGSRAVRPIEPARLESDAGTFQARIAAITGLADDAHDACKL